MAEANKKAAAKTTGTKKAGRKLYYPVRTFDDDLANVVAWAAKRKFNASTIDMKQLAADVKAQRDERQAHDDAETAFAGLHRTYGEQTEERFQRYAALLQTLRGAFRNDAAATKELDKFKRTFPAAKKATKPAG